MKQTKSFFGKLAALTLLVSISLTSFAQQNDKSLVKVRQYDGIYVFCDNEPVSEYEIIDRMQIKLAWSGHYTEIRKRFVKEAKSYPLAQAIVLNDGGRAIAIKFKNSDDENLNLARATKENGVYIFTDCDPLSEYEVLGEKKVASTARAAMGMSVSYTTVKEKLTKKAVKENPDASGILLDFGGMSDKTEIIKFK